MLRLGKSLDAKKKNKGDNEGNQTQRFSSRNGEDQNKLTRRWLTEKTEKASNRYKDELKKDAGSEQELAHTLFKRSEKT